SRLAREEIEYRGAHQEGGQRSFLSGEAGRDLKERRVGLRTVAAVAGVDREVEPRLVVDDARRRPEDQIVEDRTREERGPLERLRDGVRLGDDGGLVLVHEVGERRRAVEAQIGRQL